MSRSSLIFTFLVLCCVFRITTAQCPANPECRCSGFVIGIPTILECSNQGRTQIPVSQLSILVESLDMSDNSIILVPGALSNLTNLKRLDLSRNSLSYIPAGSFDGLVSLEVLILDGNLFSYLTLLPANFSDSQGIISLSLADNGLTTTLSRDFLSFFTNLKVLNLNSNQYEFLSPTFFEFLSSTFEELLLSDNGIRNLPVSIFSTLSQLNLLDLSQNQLDTLPVGIFSTLNSTKIRLEGNPWSCDCYLINLTSLIASSGTLNFSDAHITFCDVPLDLRTMTLSNVSSLTCFPPSFSSQPQNVSVLTTQSVAFTCSHTGLPIPHIFWYYNGIFLISSLIGSDGRISVLSDGQLDILNVELTDRGGYHCTVSNTEGDVTSSIAYLTVQEITCFDNLTSSHETDRDCGGIYCKPCDVGNKCQMDSDCENGICLYFHTIPSQLLYITENDDLAYTCNSLEAGTITLQMRIASVFFASSNLFLDTSSDSEEINQIVRQSISSQLEVPLNVISNVNLVTVERHFTPLIQMYFYLENNYYGMQAQSLLIQQINEEKLRVTLKLDILQNSIAVRINF